jgi:hypothetical protein
VSNSPSWTDCKNHLQKLILLVASRGCKAWTAVTLYGRGLSSFVSLAADDLEMSFSCARRLSDFCDVCSNLAPISSIFYSVSTQRLFSRFLAQKWPSRADFINKFMDACRAWDCDPGKWTTKFSLTLSSGTTFHIRFKKKIRCSTCIEPYPHTTITST